MIKIHHVTAVFILSWILFQSIGLTAFTLLRGFSGAPLSPLAAENLLGFYVGSSFIIHVVILALACVVTLWYIGSRRL